MSIIDIIDDITITNGHNDSGALKVEWVLASLWTRSDMQQPEQGRFRVSWQSPSGKLRIGPKIYSLDLEGSAWVRSRVLLRSVLIDGPGRYVFLIDIEEGEEWRNVARTPYQLWVESEESAPPADEAAPKKKTRRK